MLRNEQQQDPELQNEFDDKEQQLITLRQQLNECKDREKQLRKDYQEQEEIIRTEQQRVTELQNELYNEEQQLMTLRQQLDECKIQENLLKEQQQQRVTELQNELYGEEQQLMTLRQQLDECKDQENRLREQQQQRVTELQNELSHKDQQLTALTEELDQCKDQENLLREQQQQRVTELHNELSHKDQQLTALTEKLDQCKDQENLLREQQQQQVTELENELSHKDQQLTALTEKLDQCKDQENLLREQQQRVTELQNELSHKDQQLIAVTEELDQCKDQENLLREQQQQQQQQRVTELLKEVNDKDQHLTELREELQKCQHEWVINQNDIQITEHELGRGAWGVVYRGKFHGCDVAVKQMHQAIVSNYTRQSFEREVGMASKCRHPCLLQFIGATTDERPQLVTEILDCSLRKNLSGNGDVPPLATHEVPVISRDIALGLNYLHQKRTPIIHHDVSSANVLLWRQGARWRAKLSDYGTANFVRQSNIRYAGAVIYCAPELLNEHQDQPISCKVDVYSFGVLLCEMCIREDPDPQLRTRQIARIENSHFRELVERCVEEEPGARPNMEQVIEHLQTS